MSKDGGPAFPHKPALYRMEDGRIHVEHEGGMSLRDYFAAHAPPPPNDFMRRQDDRGAQEPAAEWAARWAWRWADEMLRTR